MLRHNPIRAEHEYQWYFSSRFPGTRLETLTTTMSARVVAFDSGPLAKGQHRPAHLPVTPMRSTTTNSCLGIVDWGIGGIGLVRALDEVAPGLPVLYWSDAGATPYGRMGTDDLAARLTTVVTELAERGATEVVLACNAASTVVATA